MPFFGVALWVRNTPTCVGKTALESAKARGQFSAQMAAGAMSALHVSSGVTGSGSQSAQSSNSYSYSYGESHNYNYSN